MNGLRTALIRTSHATARLAKIEMEAGVVSKSGILSLSTQWTV